MKKPIVIFSLLILIATAWFVLDLFLSAGQFKRIKAHFDGQCRPVEGVVGAEDITIHPDTGIAYISTCDRRAVTNGRPGRGAIFAYDLNAADPVPVNLTPDVDPDFQPHGISLFVGQEGPDALFVVNHQAGRHQIEIFDLVDNALRHRTTIRDPRLVSPNDIVAVDRKMFYVTNDHRYTNGVKKTAEEYLRLRRSNVLFYGGAAFMEVAGGIGYANGINISADGRTVYVCAVTERSLHLYRRNPDTNRLTLDTKLELNTGVDNVEVDSDGGLWIGAHPKLLQLLFHHF